MQHSARYTLGFATLVCVIFAVMVSSASVLLQEPQEANKAFDRRSQVLQAAGLIEPGSSPSRAEVDRLLSNAHPVLVDLETGTEVEGDAETYDQQKAKKDPARSFAAPDNRSRIQRLPDKALVYKFYDEDGELSAIVLPIEGYGLWGTLYGYLGLEADTRTVLGITYYDHKETPGLGGEVDNPRWKRLWQGRAAYDEDWNPVIEVIKGAAGPPGQDPYRVDGLSGATLTSRGVSNMLQFWLGENGFGPYLEHLREERST
ncbi:MAG: Na(+)-translocating NADH-quinone reductase subunit C [Thermoanaerobaculia bacterium]